MRVGIVLGVVLGIGAAFASATASAHELPRAPMLGEATPVELVSNQLLLLATVVGAIAALPALIEFVLDAKKRRERIALSLDDEPVSRIRVQLAGMEGVLADIADLIDRAKHPQPYADLRLGNELLIIGPALMGKKTLARRIAQLAGFDRLLTVYNPRNGDALARAKTLLRRSTGEKVMLLLPNIDQLFDDPRGAREEVDAEVEAELDALIEAVASRDNVLVVGTATGFREGSDIDNLFGMKIVLPGTPPVEHRTPGAGALLPEARAMLREVATHYLRAATRAGCDLSGLTEDEAIERVLGHAVNPAEVEDIVEAARTTAIFHARSDAASRGRPTIDGAVLDKAIRRVMAT